MATLATQALTALLVQAVIAGTLAQLVQVAYRATLVILEAE